MLPAAQLDDRALEIRHLSDHRERLVGQRTALINDLRWQLHDLDPELEVPLRRFNQRNWQQATARKLARLREGAQVWVARDELKRIRELTAAIDRLERELKALVLAYRPELLEMPGCGVLTAAKAIGETAGASRFPTAAKFARITGTAPIPASSGNTTRHRLDRGGNRQLNLAFHRFAVNRARHPETAAYPACKQAQGMSRMEALRCLKRHLARRVHHLLTDQARATQTALALT
jgi:transposase